MNVVDSSGWIEFFADGPRADVFEEPIRRTSTLIVPTLCMAEVFKVILSRSGEWAALQAIAQMTTGSVIGLGADLAVEAARIGTVEGLALADSIILATARSRGALLWTMDRDFEGLGGVRFVAR